MNLNFMRLIDRFIGVPLCMMLSIIKRLLPPDSERHEVRNIVFIELPEMGSALMSYDAINRVKTRYPAANLYFLIFKKNRDAVALLDLFPAENIVTIRSDHFLNFLIDAGATLAFFRGIKPDMVFDLELFSRFSVIYGYLTGAREIAGFYVHNIEGLYRGTLLTRRVNYNYYQHISVNYTALVKAVIDDSRDEPLLKSEIPPALKLPVCPRNPEVIDTVRALIKSRYDRYDEHHRLLVIGPGGGEFPIRGWGYDRYAELGRMILADHPRVLIIISGTRPEAVANETLAQAIDPHRCLSLSGRFTLPELIQLLHLADILLTSDGGLAHFSMLTRIRTFVFYGPETPLMYRPLGDRAEILYRNYHCSPCLLAFNYRISKCTNNKCVNDFTPREVYQRIAPVL